MNNPTWGKLLFQSLKAAGVRHCCLAPGSRVSPLSFAAAESGLEVLVHFDERGLGFLGLGLSKVRKDPVVLLVTSGSAGGNLLPAIMEASHEDIPLIIITTDRPPELRNVAANQTTDQVRMFENFVRFQVDVACADTTLTQYLAATVRNAVALSKRKKGPVHINCMLREPLGGSFEEVSEKGCHYEEGISSIPQERIEEIASELAQIEEGLVICGQDAPFQATLVAKKLGWPMFVDVTSSLRGIDDQEIRYYEHILKTAPIGTPKAILQFGRRINSKTLHEFLKKCLPSLYVQCDDSVARFDPHLIVTHRLQASPKETALSLAHAIEQKEESPWLQKWRKASEQVAARIEESLEGSYSEPGVAFELAKRTPNNIFFANSMPIRDGEFFFYPKRGGSRIFASRGLSGIDGNIATCAGIAYASETPLIAVLGDLAFLHDLNSLAILQDGSLPILFLVINNQGGGIFSFLPHLHGRQHFEKVIAYAHDYRFKNAAELFGVPYSTATSFEELSSCLTAFEEDPKTTIVEIFTNREDNLQWHKEIEERIKMLEIER